jgi:hypothetical protein
MDDTLHDAALAYHREPKPGKLEITATKPLANQRDLALAYSPGVAAACEAIAETPGDAAHYTARANLVAVITNGSATRTSWSISWRRSSRPSAASTWRTSRRPSVSTSRPPAVSA